MRRYNQARDSYKQLVALGDESAANYKQLMTLSFNLKQNDDVITYANKLKQIDPSEKISYYIGKVNYDQDNYGEAIKYLSAASIDDPQNAEVPYMIAHCYADMMNYKLAVPFFLKAIELNPAKPYWLYELGLIYYAMNDDKNSLKYILDAGDKGYTKDNDYFGLAIGFTVMAMAFCFGDYSGGAFDPAVAIGAMIMKIFAWKYIWIYLLSCFGGATLAAIVFKMNDVDNK